MCSFKLLYSFDLARYNRLYSCYIFLTVWVLVWVCKHGTEIWDVFHSIFLIKIKIGIDILAILHLLILPYYLIQWLEFNLWLKVLDIEVELYYILVINWLRLVGWIFVIDISHFHRFWWIHLKAISQTFFTNHLFNNERCWCCIWWDYWNGVWSFGFFNWLSS